ncbi:MAG: hypothetical protein ACE5QF_09885 [Thermoplasmata archaeon]
MAGRQEMADQPKIVFDESEVLALLRNKRRNSSWVQEQMAELRKEYPRKFIAVKDRRIVDSDKSFDALLRRVRRRREDLGTVTFEFISERECIYVL